MVKILFVRENEPHLHVADVETDSLEMAWVICQNMALPWAGEPRVTLTEEGLVLARAGANRQLGHPRVLRSSMVGDRYVFEGKVYEVDLIGFTELGDENEA